MAFNGQAGRNFAGPHTKHGGPRGLSALDVIIQGGYLPSTAGPVEFAAWLLEPSNAIAADLVNQVIAIAQANIGPITTVAQAYADAALASAESAQGDADFAEDEATLAEGSANAAAASATAAAGSATGAATSLVSLLANKATELDVRTGTDNTKFPTSKALMDSVAWHAAAGGEITTPGGVRTVTFGMDGGGFNRSDTLTANTTYGLPTGMSDGQTYQFLLVEDATGGRTITLNASFVFGAVAAAFTTAANTYNIISGVYSAAINKLIGCTVWKSA